MVPVTHGGGLPGATEWDRHGRTYDIQPHLSTFGKAATNGLPRSFLAGLSDVMRLGGFAEDAARVFLLSQTSAARP
jgi:glutamate-1-semialdehyde aminotransferase